MCDLQEVVELCVQSYKYDPNHIIHMVNAIREFRPNFSFNEVEELVIAEMIIYFCLICSSNGWEK